MSSFDKLFFSPGILLPFIGVYQLNYFYRRFSEKIILQTFSKICFNLDHCSFEPRLVSKSDFRFLSSLKIADYTLLSGFTWGMW